MKFLIPNLVVVGLTAITPDVSAQESSAVLSSRAITNIRGDLYRVQDGEQFLVFLITPEGIILADPLNVTTSAWLKTELETRFPGRPVRYVVYTHHAFDRAGGAATFNATAEVVAHENFTEERMKAEQALPGSLAGLDSNQDGVLDSAEIAADPFPRVPLLRDRNSDGIVTPAELYFDVSFVESTFSSRRTITLGGKSAELVHPGQAYSADMTVLHFPAERVVFAAGYPPLSVQPFSFGGSRGSEVLDSIRAVEAIDFDTFVSGDGNTGSKAMVTALRQYVEDLVAGVKAGFASRLTVDQLQSFLTLDQHQGLPHYTQRDSNIAEAYRRLRRLTATIYGVAQINRLQRGSYCAHTYRDCLTTGGPSLTGLTGIGVSAERVAVLVETTIGGDFVGHRFPDPGRQPSSIYEWTVEHRDRVMSFLARYDVVRKPSATIGFVGGLSRVSEDERRTETVRPPRGPTQFSSEMAHFGAWGRTIGVDVVISMWNRVGVVLPVRLTHAAFRQPLIGPSFPNPTGHWNVHAGVGLALMFSSAY